MASEQFAQPAQRERAEGRASIKEDFEKFGKIGQKLIGDSMEGVRMNLNEYYHKGQDKFVKAEKKVEDTIRHYPLRSLLAAVGVGFLAGLIRRH